jgi:hypothetical protein
MAEASAEMVRAAVDRMVSVVFKGAKITANQRNRSDFADYRPKGCWFRCLLQKQALSAVT